MKKTEGGQTVLYINQYYEKNLTTGVATTSYYLGGQLIATRENTTLKYVHEDSLGSTSVMTTSTGTLDSSISFYPFGGTRTGSVSTDKKFTGQRLDGTGLYYYGARYYDATIGRFISADTVIQNPANPQTLNRYSYCVNNPLKYTDPSGHTFDTNGDQELDDILNGFKYTDPDMYDILNADDCIVDVVWGDADGCSTKYENGRWTITVGTGLKKEGQKFMIAAFGHETMHVYLQKEGFGNSKSFNKFLWPWDCGWDWNLALNTVSINIIDSQYEEIAAYRYQAELCKSLGIPPTGWASIFANVDFGVDQKTFMAKYLTGAVSAWKHAPNGKMVNSIPWGYWNSPQWPLKVQYSDSMYAKAQAAVLRVLHP